MVNRSLGSSPGTLYSNPRVHDAEHYVGYEISQQRQNGDQQGDAEHRGNIESRGGGDYLDSQSAVIEDTLNDDRTTQESRKIKAQDDDDWPERIAKRVAKKDPTLAAALGFGRPNVVLHQHLQHGAAHEAAQEGNAEQGQRKYGQKKAGGVGEHGPGSDTRRR